jgi:D-3-phosphoglycerate dehydrogenase / 2-oxoglutarate reductase
MPNVLIGPAPLRNRPGRFREILERAGFTPFEVAGNHTLTEAELVPVLPRADAMLAGGELMSDRMLALAPRLRVISRTGVGYDTIDVAAATARGIVVTITPGTNHDSVAEQTFALLLALARNVVANDRVIHAGGYDRSVVQPLRGKTMGLVGLGRIGKAVASRAVAFGMRVVAHDTMADAAFVAAHGIELIGFNQLLAQADVVSLHVPLIPETRQMINKETLALMRPGSYLINTARGGLVVEDDLAESLASGHLAGAGLDVQAEEPPLPGNPLLGLPNVVMSPHIAGVDTKALSDMAVLAAECVVGLYQGKWPAECIVNRELGGRWKW